jgi:magnesium-transporting ATPase (P-type)
MILTFLVLLITTLVPTLKAINEAKDDKIEKDLILQKSNYTKSIEHKQSAVQRIILFSIISFLCCILNYFSYGLFHLIVLFLLLIPYQLIIFWILFDSYLNFLDGTDIDYIGDTAHLDKWARKHFKKTSNFLYAKVILFIFMLLLNTTMLTIWQNQH